MSPEKLVELTALADAACDETLTGEQISRLETLLRGDGEAQVIYLQRVHLHHSLRWDLGAAAESAAVQALGEPRVAVKPYRGRQLLRLSLAVAACLLIAVGIRHWLSEPVRPDIRTPPLAKLTQSIDAQWEQPTNATVGKAVEPGIWQLRSGVARIDFGNGASLTMEGPSELHIAKESVVLQRGHMTARLPAGANFHVATEKLSVSNWPAAIIGIKAEDNGAAEICVFEGDIAVALADADMAPQAVSEGTAIHMPANGGNLAASDFATKMYQKSWTVGMGVLAMTGNVKFVEPGRHRRPSQYPDDQFLIVFPEGPLTSNDALTVTATAPGSYQGPFDDVHAVVPHGQQLRSYLLQFNPVGGKKEPVRHLKGSITFDQPIRGIIASSGALKATDKLLSGEPSPFVGRGGRGLEAGDSFEISADRTTLRVDLTAAQRIDQLRVLVGEPERVVAARERTALLAIPDFSLREWIE